VLRGSIDGPLRIANICGNALANDAASQHRVSTPGINLSYGGHLTLWQTASRFLGLLNIPIEATAAAVPAVNDTWTAVMRFENNEHLWFAPVAATMAKYCQFFNGSASLNDISPVCSAAAAVKGRIVANTTTLHTHGTWVAAVAGPPAVPGHYVSRDTARFTIDAQVALRDVPDAHVYAGLTYGYNTYMTAAHQTLLRQGSFWSLGPNCGFATAVEILPGLPATISREYHRDTRLDSFKQ